MMTQGEKDIAAVLIAVATGRVTVADLKSRLAQMMELVNAVGAKNVPTKTLARLAAIESAIQRISREKSKYLN